MKTSMNFNLILSVVYVILFSFFHNDYLSYIYFFIIFALEIIALTKKQYKNVIMQILLLIPLQGITVVNNVPMANIYMSFFAIYILLFEKNYAHSRNTLLAYLGFITLDLIKIFIFSDGMNGLIGLLDAFVLYMSIYSGIATYEYIKKDRDRVCYVNSFINGTTLSILYGFVVRLLSDGIMFALMNNSILTRNPGASGDPNYFGLYIGISIALLLLRMIMKGPKVVECVLILVFGLMGMSSSSRMYYAILIFLGIVIVICFTKWLFSKGFVKALLVMIISVLLGFSMRGVLSSNFDYVLTRIANENDITNGRSTLIEQYGGFMNNGDPIKTLIGIGIPEYNIRAGISHYAHNLYVELYVTQGILGIGLIMLIIIFMLFKGMGEFAILGFVPFLVFLIGGFGVSYVEVDSFYALIALILTFIRRSNE